MESSGRSGNVLYRENCFHSGWDSERENPILTSDAVWKTSYANSVRNMNVSNVPLVVAEGKQRGFKSGGLYMLEKSKRNLIINNSWTSWTLLWVLHPVCIFVTEASRAFQQLSLPVAKISIMDDVQTATDPVLFRHLSQNPPTEVSFLLLIIRRNLNQKIGF